MDWYDHPYMDGGFNHWSGSYAYIKIESETINALRNPFASMTSGNNTAIDDINVVCAKIPLYDSLSYFVASGQQQTNIGSYGNRHQNAAGFIGVGGNICPYLDPGTNNIIYPNSLPILNQIK